MMEQRILIFVALLAIGVIDAKNSSWTVQCVHVLNKTYQICFDFLPVTEYVHLMPKLKQAIDGLETPQKSIKPKIILRALELTNPARDANEIVRRQHIMPNPLNPPDMKQWYRATILAEDGLLYSVNFGVTEHGRGYMGTNLKLSPLPLKLRLEKTKQFLADGDLKGLYEYWKPPGTSSHT